ncbi:27498_t:CDS:2 [Gigaspora margarita]|uniref:27498_t:CDS:1 n=1 Tax=Gigaspora margarita TaxID=4874 RepID=A0ABN7WFJ5_GIGMA|nr:27498_t:CDS:2 [Gigaspora margarita]
MWTDDQLGLLITKRRNRNNDYYNIPKSSRVSFWNNIVNIINKKFSTNYTEYQCKGKFQNLVRDHTLMYQYMARNHAECRTRTGAQYFEEFHSHFWERPETQFDQIHNINASSRQQEIRCHNRTSPPSYKEILSIMSCCESTTTQRNSLTSPDHRTSSNRIVSTDRNNENNEDKNRPEGLLLCNNGNNLVNTAPEHRSEGSLFRNNASQNDSDISMPDIGGSKPPSCIENINKEN